MLIDFHTHIFPKKLAERAVSEMEAHTGLNRAIDADIDSLQTSMEENGVDISVMLPVATNTHQVRKVNDFAIEVKNSYDNIVAFGSVHPDCEDLEDEIKRIKAAGLKGIKIHPDFVRYFVDDESMVRCVSVCADNELPVIVHGGIDISFFELPRCTPERVYKLMQRVKNAVVIIAHAGGFPSYNDVAMWHGENPNVYIDTSFISAWNEKNLPILKKILHEFPSDRILFGSDSPWDSPLATMNTLNKLGLDDETMQNIKHKNAQKLLGI